MVVYVCSHFNYTLHDIFVKRWRDGGITKAQILSLFNIHQKEQQEEREFTAAIHGAELKNKESSSTNVTIQTPEGEKQIRVPLFCDPNEYKDFSKEEKSELTKKMIGQHRSFVKAGGTSLGK